MTTFQERIKDPNKAALAPEFIYKIRMTAEKNGKKEDEVWNNWQKYSNDCQNSDQSPLFPEFCQWYKLDDWVDYDEPVFNHIREVA